MCNQSFSWQHEFQRNEEFKCLQIVTRLNIKKHLGSSWHADSSAPMGCVMRLIVLVQHPPEEETGEATP